jgi:hypothetical protein
MIALNAWVFVATKPVDFCARRTIVNAWIGAS